MELRVLGRLAVIRDGQTNVISSAKMRAVLAFLIIRARHPITSDELSDQLWRDNRPSSSFYQSSQSIDNRKNLTAPTVTLY